MSGSMLRNRERCWLPTHVVGTEVLFRKWKDFCVRPQANVVPCVRMTADYRISFLGLRTTKLNVGIAFLFFTGSEILKPTYDVA
jgi:hypothetical protein